MFQRNKFIYCFPFKQKGGKLEIKQQSCSKARLFQNTRKRANENQASDQVISIHPHSLFFSLTPNAFQTAFEASTILFEHGGW
jgi:hypothetical protein